MKWFLVFLFVVQTGESTQKVVEGKEFEGFDARPYTTHEACLEKSKFFYRQTWEKLPYQILNIYTRCELRDK
ncbi:MAG: hypothetical protein GKR97_07385 [Rhizobiaceae bacterium]|nr:hypothetical protein [Rhizobiaceae bacterium]